MINYHKNNLNIQIFSIMFTIFLNFLKIHLIKLFISNINQILYVLFTYLFFILNFLLKYKFFYLIFNKKR